MPTAAYQIQVEIQIQYNTDANTNTANTNANNLKCLSNYNQFVMLLHSAGLVSGADANKYISNTIANTNSNTANTNANNSKAATGLQCCSTALAEVSGAVKVVQTVCC